MRLQLLGNPEVMGRLKQVSRLRYCNCACSDAVQAFPELATAAERDPARFRQLCGSRQLCCHLLTWLSDYRSFNRCRTVQQRNDNRA